MNSHHYFLSASLLSFLLIAAVLRCFRCRCDYEVIDGGEDVASARTPLVGALDAVFLTL